MKHTLYNIKITLERSTKKAKYYTDYKDEWFFVQIKDGTHKIEFAVQATDNRGKDLKKVFKKIQEELHLC